MNYKSWNDEELRRVLITDPDDTAAICEAAERFAKQEPERDEDERHEFDIPVTCPECEYEWDEVVDFNDYRDRR
jgi:hypothetical protein